MEKIIEIRKAKISKDETTTGMGVRAGNLVIRFRIPRDSQPPIEDYISASRNIKYEQCRLPARWPRYINGIMLEINDDIEGIAAKECIECPLRPTCDQVVEDLFNKL